MVGTYEWYFVILWIHVEWWGHSEVVGTLNPYLLFELFALTGGGDAKTSARSYLDHRVPTYNVHSSHLVKLKLHNF